MNPNPMRMYFYRVIEHWHGQVAVAAAIASINFVAMYCVYLNLSERLPDGTKSYEITGVYRKYTDMKGRTDSTLNRKTIYCGISAFSEVSCGFDGDGEMTVTIDRFPLVWGDVDAVVTAKNDQKYFYDSDTLEAVEY